MTSVEKNDTNLRHADDALFVSDEEDELQTTITRLGEICKDYGMEVNVKKTKTMAFSKSGKMQCSVASFLYFKCFYCTSLGQLLSSHMYRCPCNCLYLFYDEINDVT